MEGKHFGHMVELVIAVILMFIIPTIYFQQKKDDILQNHVEQNTYHTVDTITTSGYITKELYDNYLYGLSTTGEVYDVNMEAKERVLEPEYRMKTVDEIIGEHNNAWNGSNTYTYVPVMSQAPAVNDVVDLTGLTTETNESVLRNSTRTGADPNHVHTAECFDGHIHEGEPYFYHQHAHTTSCKEFRSVWHEERRCNRCQVVFQRFIASWYWDDITNSVKVGSSYTVPVECGNCGSTSTTFLRDVEGFAYSCGYVIDINNDNLTDKVPIGQMNSYKRSDPQSKERADYVNGCYSYHQSNIYTTGKFFNEASKRYRYSSLNQTISEFRNNGYKKYCIIPRIYNFTAMRDGTNRFSISYRTEVQANGDVLLRYYGGSYSPYNYNLLTHTFPTLITFDQLYSMVWHRTVFFNAIKQYAPIAEIPSYQWDYIDYSMTGWDEAYICGIGDANQWISTCGYDNDTGISCSGELYNSQSGSKVIALVSTDSSFHIDYHVYRCTSCDKGIVTFNFRNGISKQGIGDLYIGEISNRMIDFVDNRMTNLVSSLGYSGYRYEMGIFSSDDGMNIIAQMLGTRLYPINQTKYKDSISIIKENSTYFSYSLTKYTSGSGIATKTVKHMPLKDVVLMNGTFVCNEIISHISATHPNQIIYQYDPWVRCVTLTYLDGSTEVVLGNSTFVTNIVGANQRATITYYGKDTKTTYRTFSTLVTIRVIPKYKTCTNGHNYRIGTSGADPGCIYCKELVRYLQVVEPSDKKLTLRRGQALSEADIYIRAWYYDGHVDNLRTGFLHNYDKNYVGVQTVTIGYKGRYETLQVTVTVNTKRCNICNRYYDLMPDDRDMGCPYCASLVPVFTGQVMEYYNVIPHDEIMKVIYDENSKYKLQIGDYINITVKNRTKTTGMKLLDQLFGASHTVSMKYGSKIRDTR